MDGQNPDLSEASKIWSAYSFNNKKLARDSLERYYDARWPFYTYRERAIIEYLRDAQDYAEKTKAHTPGGVPLFYDLQNDELFTGRVDEGGEWMEAYNDRDEYKRGNHVIVLYDPGY